MNQFNHPAVFRTLSASILAFSFVGGNLLGKPQIANASPAPIFQPVLNEVQSQLPQGIVMRLPSSVEYLSSLYPTVMVRGDGLVAALSSRSACQAIACQRGYLGVFNQNSDDQHVNYLRSQRLGTNSIVNRTSINLTKIVQGSYVDVDTRGVSSGRYGAIVWNQDGFTFVVSGVGSKSDIERIARSMAKELPIRK